MGRDHRRRISDGREGANRHRAVAEQSGCHLCPRRSGASASGRILRVGVSSHPQRVVSKHRRRPHVDEAERLQRSSILLFSSPRRPAEQRSPVLFLVADAAVDRRWKDIAIGAARRAHRHARRVDRPQGSGAPRIRARRRNRHLVRWRRNALLADESAVDAVLSRSVSTTPRRTTYAAAVRTTVDSAARVAGNPAR